MKLSRNKLNSKGFSHIELGFVLIVIVGIAAVGYWVFKHASTSRAAQTYTTLAAINADGHIFTEQACITAQAGTSPNYTDTVTALISVGTQAGPSTVTSTRHHKRTYAYNPLAYYSIAGAKAVTKDNWTTGSTSTISFNLPPTASTSTFVLGVVATPGSSLKSPGSSQTVGSLTLCNPPSSPAPTVSLAASPTTLNSGSSSTLSWSSTNATTCTASGTWNGGKATSGSSSTGSLTVTSSYTLSCTGSGGSASASTTVTVNAPTPVVAHTTPAPSSTSCATAPPTTSSDSLYPLQQVVNFTGSTLPSQWQDYGNGIQQPAGAIAASHAVFVPGTGLELQSYTDPVSGSVGGVTSGSGDVDIPVATSGGYDVCFTMSSGNWQNVHLVVISWPTDNNWNEGENDFFEGNPQGMGINVHEIGSSPATNVWQGNWPSSLASGTHVISSRWDPINGYRFYLDGTLVATAPVGGSVTTPTTSHHISIQMQDTSESSTSSESTTIYWVASYGYSK
jgi:hypothetical protein